MAKNLRVFDTAAAYEAEKDAHTLALPNVALIKSPVREIRYLQTNPEVGVGICALINGVRAYYTLQEYRALETKPAAAQIMGVYVKAPYISAAGGGFIIHPTAQSKQKYSSNTTVVVPGVTTTMSTAAALTDFAGMENTDALLAAVANGVIPDAPSATWVRSQVFPDGATPFNGALGQINLMKLNEEEINLCMDEIGGVRLYFESYVGSSTQYSANYCWYWGGTRWSYNDKVYAHACRALCFI